MIRSQPRSRGQELLFLESTIRRNSDLCPDCDKVIIGLHQCKIACHYCHDFHLKKDLIENICPLVYPFARKEQEKHSYECKSCKGEGSYTEQVETIRYESNKKYQEAFMQWTELMLKQQKCQVETPIRRILHKQKFTKEVQCFDCQGKGRVMRMIFCCSTGCRACNGDRYIVNPIWKKYRKQPIINEHIFQCAICLMDVQEQRQKYTLSCKHEFHPNCIFRWMKTKKNCPVCRQTDVYMEGIEFPESLENIAEERADSIGPFFPQLLMMNQIDDSWDLESRQ